MLGLLLLPVVLGAVAPLYRQERFIEEDGLRSYIIVFGDNAPDLSFKEAVQKWITLDLPAVDPSRVGHVYNIDNIFRGFSAFLNLTGLEEIRAHSYTKYVQEDGVVELNAFTDRQDWGQIRINNLNGVRNLATNNAAYSYANSYPDAGLSDSTWNFTNNVQAVYQSDGSSSSVCVVDTGILSTHQEFTGRVDATTSFVLGEPTDGNGHGTHVAGSCCGTSRGTARRARIAAAKVLNNRGSGSNSNVIAGINWCANRATDTSRTWVISLSLGGAASTATDDAIDAASVRSVPVVAAGNDYGDDACSYSPARSPKAITVAASDKDDVAATFTNTGTCINIWAPGVYIHSSWYTATNDYNTISGTSMATPLVSGLVAYYGTLLGALTFNNALQLVQSRSVQGAIKNCPANTVNYLAWTGRQG